MYKTDVLIIGSGIAGLSTAIKIAEKRPDLRIDVFTKTSTGESNTKYAQGGVAAVFDLEMDSLTKHIEDTLDAGDDLSDPKVVEFVVKEGPERVQEIIKWGARFDKAKDGEYDLGREGGHSENRILHYKDLTGKEIQRTLIEKSREFKNIHIHEHFFALDLLTEHHLGYNITRLSKQVHCYGAYVLNKKNNQIETFLARSTVVATGGAGQIYKTTTNPVIATGDGMAMVYRAKARLTNMEFVQFHPTSLFNPAGENPSFLISEAVRGFGAVLKSKKDASFMENYDPRLSLAPRDIVARAIDNEMKIHGDDFVHLDCTHLDKDGFIEHFPTIYAKCLTLGIDPMQQSIPVLPACHYMCGGIEVNYQGETSIKGLYACGECTGSGLHGANRLASNSLLEAMVFAHRIAVEIPDKVDSYQLRTDIPEWNAKGTTKPKEMVLITQSIKEVKEIMSSYVGIVRSNVRLKRAMDRLFLLYRETETIYQSSIISPQLCELRNIITISYLVTRSASQRKESRGLHYTTDYPDKHPFLEDTVM